MTTENTQLRCLIIERHDWETGGREQQLQIPLAVAEQFFGPGDTRQEITVRVFQSPGDSAHGFEKQISISVTYENGTRRVNEFDEIGDMPSCFLFFEETGTPNTYDVWRVIDKAIVAARFDGWRQGGNSQYGRGRLAAIVSAPVQRDFTRI